MNVDEEVRAIYEALFSRGLVSSQRQFSQHWLGCSPNYLADAANRKSFSREALVTLIHNLNGSGQVDLAARATTALFTKIMK